MTKEIELYEIPEVLEKAEILDDSLLAKYNDSFAGWNERARATLGKMRSINGELAGSSPLMIIRMHNAGILPKDSRLSTRQDLQNALDFYARANNGANFTERVYVDVGLALRTAGDKYAPNDALAKKLAEQLQSRGIALNKGVLIPISALRDSEDSSERYGLTLDLNDFTTKETIKDLREFTWGYTRDNGLACAVRGGWDWSSSNEGLGRSDFNGRVVVVRAVCTRPAKILEQRLNNYASQREKHIEGLKQLRDKINADL